MILFAGDSFSHFHDEDTWTLAVSEKLKLPFKNLSLGGSSIWYTFDKIQKNNIDILSNRYEYLIITCTSPQRIPFCKEPNMSYYTGNPEPETFDEKNYSKDIAHFAYYERFFNRDMHIYLYYKILSEISYQLANHIKIIFLPCFQESLDILKKIYKENQKFSYIDFPLTKIASNNTAEINYKNHFTKEMNNTFGKLLSEKAKQKSYGSLNLSIKEIKEAMK